tara:strand:- start:10 stop:576 length:567 start_codon:yes stop_codon:yes gene_type:complete
MQKKRDSDQFQKLQNQFGTMGSAKPAKPTTVSSTRIQNKPKKEKYSRVYSGQKPVSRLTWIDRAREERAAQRSGSSSQRFRQSHANNPAQRQNLLNPSSSSSSRFGQSKNYNSVSPYRPTENVPQYAYAPAVVDEYGNPISSWRKPTAKEVLIDFAFFAGEFLLVALGKALIDFFAGNRRFHAGPNAR